MSSPMHTTNRQSFKKVTRPFNMDNFFSSKVGEKIWKDIYRVWIFFNFMFKTLLEVWHLYEPSCPSVCCLVCRKKGQESYASNAFIGALIPYTKMDQLLTLLHSPVNF